MFDFLAAHIWPILAGVVALGPIAVAVAVFGFGVPAALIVANLVGSVKALLQFFTTPTGQVIAVAAMVAIAFFSGDIHRARVDVAKCQTAVRVVIEAAKRAAAKRDADIRAEVTTDANARIAAIQAESADLAKRETENERTLPADQTCRATDDDLKRLRNLRL